jgi:hypothetical protein
MNDEVKKDDKISREIELAALALKKDEESARKNKERIRTLQREKRRQWETYVGETLADIFYEQESENKTQFTANAISLIRSSLQLKPLSEVSLPESKLELPDVGNFPEKTSNEQQQLTSTKEEY